MNTLLPFLDIASAVVGAAAATLSLTDAIVRRRISRGVNRVRGTRTRRR